MDLKKGIPDIDHWDEEHLFYNKHFTLKHDQDKTLSITPHFERSGLYTFVQFLNEKVQERRNQVFDQKAVTLWDNIFMNPYVEKEDTLQTNDGTIFKFPSITHQDLYVNSIFDLPNFHHSQVKWSNTLGLPLDWSDIWNTVHNPLSTNKTTSIIWQQLHLNFYTQYSYNKWHKVNMACPLCGKIPESIFHIVLKCDLVSTIWEDIKPVLLRLHPAQLSDEEKAFGIVYKKPSPGMCVRNWLTFLMRKCIAKMERVAYYCNSDILARSRQKIQYCIEKELDKKHFICSNDGNMDAFENFFAYRNVICRKNREHNYVVRKVFF